MNKISTKGIYGLEALYYIALNDHKKPLQIHEIASHTDTPQNYLEQILSIMKNAGILSSIRGPKGGYMLGKKLEEIVIYDVLVLLEGDFLETKKVKLKAMKIFWSEVSLKFQNILSLTLKDLLEYEQRVHDDGMYFI